VIRDARFQDLNMTTRDKDVIFGRSTAFLGFPPDEIHLLQRMATKIEALKAKSDDRRPPAPKLA
jgi:hypothetical protein